MQLQPLYVCFGALRLSTGGWAAIANRCTTRKPRLSDWVFGSNWQLLTLLRFACTMAGQSYQPSAFVISTKHLTLSWIWLSTLFMWLAPVFVIYVSCVWCNIHYRLKHQKLLYGVLPILFVDCRRSLLWLCSLFWRLSLPLVSLQYFEMFFTGYLCNSALSIRLRLLCSRVCLKLDLPIWPTAVSPSQVIYFVIVCAPSRSGRTIICHPLEKLIYVTMFQLKFLIIFITATNKKYNLIISTQIQ